MTFSIHCGTKIFGGFHAFSSPTPQKCTSCQADRQGYPQREALFASCRARTIRWPSALFISKVKLANGNKLYPTTVNQINLLVLDIDNHTIAVGEGKKVFALVGSHFKQRILGGRGIRQRRKQNSNFIPTPYGRLGVC